MDKIEEPKSSQSKKQYEIDYITCVNSSSSFDLKQVWVRAGKPAKKQMSMCFRLDKSGFMGNGVDIAPSHTVNFHMGEGKKEVKQISITDRTKQKYRVTHLDKEHFVKEPGVNYARTETFKIPPGFIIVGVRVPLKADLYSTDCVPICNVIIMKTLL